MDAPLGLPTSRRPFDVNGWLWFGQLDGWTKGDGGADRIKLAADN